MVAVFQHGIEVAAHALHAPRADGFDPGLLHRIIDGARILRLGSELAVDPGIMTGQTQGHGIGIAAQDGEIMRGHLARWLRQAGLVRHQHGPVGSVGHLEFRHARDGPQAGRDRALDRLVRGFPGFARLAVRDRHASSAPVDGAGAVITCARPGSPSTTRASSARGVSSARHWPRFAAIPRRSNADRIPPQGSARARRTC